MTDGKKTGEISWVDLTVTEAEDLRTFYEAVAGWESRGVDMGGYEDFSMIADSGEPAAGICHARATNLGLPAQWLIYINVSDLDVSIDRCRALGGQVVFGPKEVGGHGRYCVIQDPAGAVAALFEPRGE